MSHIRIAVRSNCAIETGSTQAVKTARIAVEREYALQPSQSTCALGLWYIWGGGKGPSVENSVHG